MLWAQLGPDLKDYILEADARECSKNQIKAVFRVWLLNYNAQQRYLKISDFFCFHYKKSSSDVDHSLDKTPG